MQLGVMWDVRNFGINLNPAHRNIHILSYFAKPSTVNNNPSHLPKTILPKLEK
jgi:hypothetical protein